MGRKGIDWWLYAKNIVRDYPNLLRERREAPAGGATGGLPPKRQKRLEAIEYAIGRARQLEQGEARLQVVRMVYWDKSHTIAGAAMRVPCGEATARRWQAQFLRDIGDYLDLV